MMFAIIASALASAASTVRLFLWSFLSAHFVTQRTTSCNYKYTKLDTEKDEIRLIKLLPGNHEEEISFTIFHVSLTPPRPETSSKRLQIPDLLDTLPQGWKVRETLDGRYLFIQAGQGGKPNSWDHPDISIDRSLYDRTEEPFTYKPEFEALSYTWGSTENSVIANINDTLDCTIKLGNNLACALKNLRCPTESRILWIDAICINQSDINERNAQVKRMGNIYSLAKRVVVWLGEETEDSRHALATLEYFGKQVEYTVDNTICDAPGATEQCWYKVQDPLPYDDMTWSSLISIFGRAWFSRVWVLQEIQLGNSRATFHCGPDSVSWSAIRKALLVFVGKAGVPPALDRFISSYPHGIMGKQLSTIPRLLQWSRDRDSTDPRDRIYGLLNLSPPSIQERIHPQYTLLVQQVYSEVFLAHLEVSKRLDLLRHCWIKCRFPNGPSWLPNWSEKIVSFQGRFINYRQPFGLSSAHTEIKLPGFLDVTGLQCAHVSSVVAALLGGEGKEELEILQNIRQMEPENLRSGSYVSGGTSLDAFLEVLYQGRTKTRYPNRFQYPTLDELRSEYVAATSEPLPNLRKMDLIDHLRIDSVAFFTTQEGYYGVGPTGIEPGDIVCGLLGCDRPMLLRRTDSSSFLVVGPCFVHGLMDGESVLGSMPPSWTIQLKTRYGVQTYHFVNKATTTTTTDDPRLPSLPDKWTQVLRERTQDDPLDFKEFRNKATGEIINSDPRMLPEALQQRGVKLQTFRLQ